MARPYSKDLRDRVVGSVAGGRSCRATAALFGERGEVVAALSRDRQRSGVPDGRSAAATADRRAGLAPGADRREAGPHLASGGGRAGRARPCGELRRGMAGAPPPGGAAPKKKTTPPGQSPPAAAPRRGPVGEN